MRYSYAVQVVREDGTQVGQVPVQVDWEPAREWVRLKALERGVRSDDAFTRDCACQPVWDPARGQPYLGGFQLSELGDTGAQESFSIVYFGELARGITKRMVAEGTLQKGDLIRCHPLAFPEVRDPELRHSARVGRAVPPRIAVGQASLQEFLNGEGGDPVAPADHLPVFIPERILEEIGTLTLAEQAARETGGILIGHLFRDDAESKLFAEVTAQIPARHTEAGATKLTFTPATWTDVRAALALRTRGEIMLGWWHSHPVREWCKDCPEEKRRECALARGFLSEEDRLLHRTVFPRAYSLALVVNDVEENGPTFSLFGWHHGVIEAREFHRLTEDLHALSG